MGQMTSDSPAPFYAVFPRSVPFLSFRGAFPSCHSEERSLPVIPRSIPFLSFRGAFPSCHSEEHSLPVIPRSILFLSFRGAFPSCHSEEHSLPVIPRSEATRNLVPSRERPDPSLRSG